MNRLVLFGLVAMSAPAVAQERPLPGGCPVCGSGFTSFFEWQCVDFEWQLILVGLDEFGTCSGVPERSAGRKTDCFETIRDVGGGGEDYGQCYRFECEEPPTTRCGPWTGDIPRLTPEDNHPGDGDDWWNDLPFAVDPPDDNHPGNP